MSTKSPEFGTFVDRFLTNLSIGAALPPGIEVLNPYSSEDVRRVVAQMCTRFYTGSQRRVAIWGINPGRLGAGITGLAFTDPFAVKNLLGIDSNLHGRRELSAEFVQLVIEAYGGPLQFYSDFFLTALSPLGFTNGAKNVNFYDTPELLTALTSSINSWVHEQMTFGIRRDVTIVLGTGRLRDYFSEHIHQQFGFEHVHYLEHPRFVMQYRRRNLAEFVDKYVHVLRDSVRPRTTT